MLSNFGLDFRVDPIVKVAYTMCTKMIPPFKFVPIDNHTVDTRAPLIFFAGFSHGIVYQFSFRFEGFGLRMQLKIKLWKHFGIFDFFS